MQKEITPNIPYEKLVTVSHYARLHAVNPKTVYQWIKEQKLFLIYVLGKRWVDKSTPAPKTYNIHRETPVSKMN